jgi:putative pyruvate formate lyase activating enzyme
MLELKQHGCHNINFVSPSHYVPQIVEALTIAIPLGFNLPLVYNTNAYDSLATLEELNGIIDIYLPDLKYASNMMAKKYSKAPGYVEIARVAIKEMFRQVDNLKINSKGIALRGLIVRHLILPNNLSGTNESLEWLAREISPFLTLSLMSQYHPSHHALENNLLNRPISRKEYRSALQVLRKTRLNGWIQGLDSPRNYLPDFEVSSHPFEF